MAWIHRPHAAPREVLDHADVVIGETYPALIVDLKETRQRALAALPGK
jgi:deoxyribodipyrimidine photo-lyase